jgi:hypothetical protein
MWQKTCILGLLIFVGESNESSLMFIQNRVHFFVTIKLCKYRNSKKNPTTIHKREIVAMVFHWVSSDSRHRGRLWAGWQATRNIVGHSHRLLKIKLAVLCYRCNHWGSLGHPVARPSSVLQSLFSTRPRSASS